MYLELACACYTLAPLHRLRVCCDFVNWLFHLDDLADDMDDRSTIAIGNEIMNTYHHPDTYNPMTHVGKLTKRFVSPAQGPQTRLNSYSRCSYWTRILADGSPGAQKRFVHTVGLFFKAVTIQARDRSAGTIPDLEDYITLRRDTSACKPCWALIEYANGLDLPDEVMEHPIIQSLDEATNDLVTWSNVRTRRDY